MSPQTQQLVLESPEMARLPAAAQDLTMKAHTLTVEIEHTRVATMVETCVWMFADDSETISGNTISMDGLLMPR